MRHLQATPSAQDVSKEIETLRTGLDPNAPKPFDRTVAYQLYRQLLEPIEGIIAQKKRLSFVFDGALTSLPPQVLITSDPNNKDLGSLDWLIRKYAITVLPSIASLKILRGQQSTVAAPKPMIGFWRPCVRQDGANCCETEGVGSQSKSDEFLPGRNRRYGRARQSTTSSAGNR